MTKKKAGCVLKERGRPPSPHKVERLAIATHLVNQGLTFKEAAERKVTFYDWDTALRAYVPDRQVNERMPQTKEGRRTTLYNIRKELLAECSSPDVGLKRISSHVPLASGLTGR